MDAEKPKSRHYNLRSDRNSCIEKEKGQTSSKKIELQCKNTHQKLNNDKRSILKKTKSDIGVASSKKHLLLNTLTSPDINRKVSSKRRATFNVISDNNFDKEEDNKSSSIKNNQLNSSSLLLTPKLKPNSQLSLPITPLNNNSFKVSIDSPQRHTEVYPSHGDVTPPRPQPFIVPSAPSRKRVVSTNYFPIDEEVLPVDDLEEPIYLPTQQIYPPSSPLSFHSHGAV